ncbi:hypothetical protein RM549_01535 [Salegentibacter sp. F188]|uniref:Thioredoxin domain-containing protein n=1 Tax=Autumnicola patrickiae TaxID=3075591 RepID=A0ABU3DXP1_9FLAO|nr:hypothetical protein [Salegentibacter sp. F188]MDT0688450.1 hypothetical protein [Salegentibacter sp. F188]
MKYIHHLLFLLVILLSACNRSQDSGNKVYIGGQIVNPNTHYVILAKNEKNLDTLFLNQKNQFGAEYESLQEGIYTLRHNPENQVIYVEPGDSVLVWSNTLQFDKSMNFSGRGSEKSSFLLDLFLKNEKNNDLILSYYKFNPEKFSRITDSIKAQRMDMLQDLDDQQKFSENFIDIARTVIDYEYYDLRERYTFLIGKYNTQFADEIPEDFHDYRDDIDFNNEALQDYTVYTNLIDDYLRSKSIEDCNTGENRDKECFELGNYHNIRRRIILIDSLTTLPYLKHEFLDQLVTRGIIMSKNQDRVDSILEVLEEINYRNMEEAEDLALIHRNFFEGTSIKENQLINTSKQLVTYGNIINKPSVIFIWSLYAPSHYKWQHNNIKNLRKKYPDINFIGVNIDQDETEKWLRVISSNNYNKDYEYQISNREVSKEVFRKYIYKTFFVNSNSIIIDADAKLYNSNFEKELLEFLNQ